MTVLALSQKLDLCKGLTSSKWILNENNRRWDTNEIYDKNGKFLKHFFSAIFIGQYSL